MSKLYGPAPTGPESRYSPPACIGTRTHEVSGSPAPEHVSTSYVVWSEQQFIALGAG